MGGLQVDQEGSDRKDNLFLGSGADKSIVGTDVGGAIGWLACYFCHAHFTSAGIVTTGPRERTPRNPIGYTSLVT